jgi:hypothetical protein
MSLDKEFIRDGKRRIVGSVTSGFSDESAVVRDEDQSIRLQPSTPPAHERRMRSQDWR